MAKLQRTFLQGKMNKDLDERLIPNGQYRDAQNIQVSTSEGSDVGAVENMLGNVLQDLRSTGPNVFWGTNFGMQQTPKCIGTVKDSQNEKIYWFLATDPDGIAPTSAIVEYDQVTSIVAPVIVDIDNVLNFNELNLITGVNILEGLLYWTDDLNEPKVINIATFKAGSTNFITQTHVYGAARNFVESDVVVIKKAPQTALTALASPSLIGGAGTGITPILTNSFAGLADAKSGETKTIPWGNAVSPVTWPVNSSITLNAEIKEPNGSIEKYQVIGEFTTALNNASFGDIVVSAATPDIPNVSLVWTMLLIEDDPIFREDFPRFSYRYKFTDGRYSPYATFSNASFVPGEFRYLSRDGDNEGMKSMIRKIDISNFAQIPFDVKEIEVLYKGSRSNNVYLIESFEYDFSAVPQPTLSLALTSGTLGRVIESVQLLRLFDAVPKKAKAQEVIGNRVIYGNYLQNYNISNSSVDVVASQINATHSAQYFGLASVKTDREYQIGITFLDDYGRESPVFTSATGAISLDIANSFNVNSVQAKLNAFTAPTEIKKFKYYVKEPSAEYYNIALDRYYNSEDGGAWLSFPSSERNKVKEGQYIILKKQHDTNVPVTVNNKYKILDLSNEAPEFLTSQKIIKARATCSTLAGGNDFQVGNSQVRFRGPTRVANPVFYDSFVSKFNTNVYIRFQQENGSTSTAEYRVISGAQVGVIAYPPAPGTPVDYPLFEVQLSEPLKEQDQWIANFNPGIPTDFLALVFEESYINTPEFQGRFFAKVNPNATFYDNVAAAFAGGARLVLDRGMAIEESGTGINPPITVNSFYTFWEGFSTQANSELPWEIDIPNPNPPAFNYSDKTTFVLSAADTDWTNNTERDQNFKYQSFTQLIGGANFKFKYLDGSVSQDFYSIINTNGIGNDVSPGGITEDSVKYYMNRAFDDTQYLGVPDATELTGIALFRNEELEDQELLSSSNPAIFETEPQEQADLDLFYEATAPIDISDVNTVQTLNWFNVYSFGNGVESDRIRDDFNAPLLGDGVRVSSTIEKPYVEERVASGMIFSGIFNSISGVNNTNQFLLAENITKNLNPTYGSLQKLHARDTDLIALLEDKCFRILANKDALYNADGSTNVTASNNVLGQTVPFVGEYGISKNPESFASFGFRSYFTDKARGAVMRLSRDGLTDIGDKGMSYFFQDRLKTNVNTNIIGAYDADIGSYNVVLGDEGVSFKEQVDGWNTRMSYDPEFGISLNNEYYTFKNGSLWEHSNTVRSNFYGVQERSTVTPIFNDAPTSIKNFKTLSYEGTAGWTAAVETKKQVGTQGNPVASDPLYVPGITGTVSTWKEREGIYFNYIMGDGTTLANFDAQDFSVQGLGNVLSHDPGSTIIFINGEINVSLQPGDVVYSNYPNNVLRVIGTVLKVERSNNFIRLTSAIPGATPVPGNFMLFAKDSQVNTSGLLGYYAEVKLTNSSNFKEELFAVNSEIFISSE